MSPTPPNPNPTPKARTLEDPKFISAHRTLLENPQLDLSLERAMLQMQRELCGQMNPDEARAAHYQMTGAIQFVNIFKRLSEPPQQRKPMPQNQLE